MSLHLDMGKYALYVWPAWALSAVVLGGLTIDTLRKARKAAAELKRREGETPK